MLGILHYTQYYTFVILSERLESFSIQKRNYIVLFGKIFGRSIFFCVMPFATRRFMNFLITSVLFVFPLIMFILSYLLSGDTLNLVGIAFTGKSIFWNVNLKCSFVLSAVFFRDTIVRIPLSCFRRQFEDL